MEETPQLAGGKGRITQTKKDNKDCKKIDRDLSMNDLYMQQHIHYENQTSNTKNGFKNNDSHQASDNKSRGDGASKAVLIDFRHGTFRSPKGSPTPHLHPHGKGSYFGNMDGKVVESSTSDNMLSSNNQKERQMEMSKMNFFDSQAESSMLLRQRTHHAHNSSQNERVAEPAHQEYRNQREMAGFVSPVTRHQQSASLQQPQNKLEISESTSG